MALYTISDLKGALGAGAQINKFLIDLTPPAGVDFSAVADNGTSYYGMLCHSTSYPSKTLGTITVFEQGRELLIPGDTDFDRSWTVSFYLTADHALRKAFIDWTNLIDNYSQNKHTLTPSSLMVTARVKQLAGDGSNVAVYEMYNMFPSNISEVRVDGTQKSQILTFDVTLSYSHWEYLSTDVGLSINDGSGTLASSTQASVA